MPRQHTHARKTAERTIEGEGRPQWSGTLSFGLVSIPVDLYPATRSGGVALRLLAPDGTPLARRFFRADADEPLSRDQLVRGYEHERGKHVVVTDEELESLAPDKSRDIDLRSFVAEAELDPMYFERAFFLVPTGTSTKAYDLLTSVMQRKQQAGIATFVMREREYLVAILSKDGLLHAQTLRFPDELRSSTDLELPRQKRLAADEVEPFVKAIRKQARADFDPSRLHNEGGDALRELAKKKARNKKNVVHSTTDADVATDAQVIDLMEVLQRSLQGKGGAVQLKASLRKRSKGQR